MSAANEKRQGDAPLQCEQPGPHGHPDVALPIHNRIPKKGCNGGKKKEKPLFLPAWDWQEATVTPHIVGKARVGEEGLVCQEIPVGFALETNAVTIFVVCSSTSRLLSLPGTKPVLERVKISVIIGTPKTQNSIRDIPMNKELLKMLRPLKKIVNGKFYVLTNEEKPTEPRTYRNYYKRMMEQLNIPPLKFHGLRHSFATRCIESNCDYKTVSVILGHSDITTTLNLYVHPNMEQKKRCIDKVFKSIK